ncbi:hypothetical protein GCM10029964_051970 [Kibdelosporangium lantanae]
MFRWITVDLARGREHEPGTGRAREVERVFRAERTRPQRFDRQREVVPGDAAEARWNTTSAMVGNENGVVTSCSTNRNRGWSRTESSAPVADVTRLSTATTSVPAANNAEHRWAPTNPAPPVTTASSNGSAMTDRLPECDSDKQTGVDATWLGSTVA